MKLSKRVHIEYVGIYELDLAGSVASGTVLVSEKNPRIHKLVEGTCLEKVVVNSGQFDKEDTYWGRSYLRKN